MPSEISLPMEDPSTRTVKGGGLQTPTIQMLSATKSPMSCQVSDTHTHAHMLCMHTTYIHTQRTRTHTQHTHSHNAYTHAHTRTHTHNTHSHNACTHNACTHTHTHTRVCTRTSTNCSEIIVCVIYLQYTLCVISFKLYC